MRKNHTVISILVGLVVTRDGTTPSEFRRIAREPLRPYDVSFREVPVERIEPIADDGLSVRLGVGELVRCRRVLLAAGLVDVLPDLQSEVRASRARVAEGRHPGPPAGTFSLLHFYR